jgi:hypothetical protein
MLFLFENVKVKVEVTLLCCYLPLNVLLFLFENVKVKVKVTVECAVIILV